MWIAASALATVLLIRPSRATEVARKLLGDEPIGITISERYSGYLFINRDQRQVCLAHLSRDFIRMAEGEPDFRWIGARISNALGEVFRLWHLLNSGDIERHLLQRWTSQLRARMFALLDEGARSSGYESPGRCREILKTEPAMWTFLYHEDVEPTNNVGEQKARIGVMYRKVSQRTRSDRGTRFVERVLTTSAMMRQQGRSVAQHIIDVAHTVADRRARARPHPVRLTSLGGVAALAKRLGGTSIADYTPWMDTYPSRCEYGGFTDTSSDRPLIDSESRAELARDPQPPVRPEEAYRMKLTRDRKAEKSDRRYAEREMLRWPSIGPP